MLLEIPVVQLAVEGGAGRALRPGYAGIGKARGAGTDRGSGDLPKGGADVVFAPGLFEDSWSKDNILSSETGARSTCQTTCTVIQFRSGIFTYEKRIHSSLKSL